MTKPKLQVLDHAISTTTKEGIEYINITDIAKYKNPSRVGDIIRNWLRNRNTIEFIGIWEQLNNPDFNYVEFDVIKKEAGLNSFTLSPKEWIAKTNAIGLISKQRRYAGTFAQNDIAFEFASWISVAFKLYLIKEFQRLKEQEFQQLGWDIKRNLAEVNYSIHTDAVKENLIPDTLSSAQISYVYAHQTHLPNMALFALPAKKWGGPHPGFGGQ